MNKKIETYNDLLEEKKRLEILQVTQKADIKHSWEGVKESLTPVTNVFSFLGKVTHRKHLSPILDFGIDMAGDVVLRKILLSKADWVTRLLLPMFIKNYSSNVLGGVKGSTFFGKIRNIFSRRRSGASHSSEMGATNFPSESEMSSTEQYPTGTANDIQTGATVNPTVASSASAGSTSEGRNPAANI